MLTGNELVSAGHLNEGAGLHGRGRNVSGNGEGKGGGLRSLIGITLSSVSTNGYLIVSIGAGIASLAVVNQFTIGVGIGINVNDNLGRISSGLDAGSVSSLLVQLVQRVSSLCGSGDVTSGSVLGLNGDYLLLLVATIDEVAIVLNAVHLDGVAGSVGYNNLYAVNLAINHVLVEGDNGLLGLGGLLLSLEGVALANLIALYIILNSLSGHVNNLLLVDVGVLNGVGVGVALYGLAVDIQGSTCGRAANGNGQNVVLLSELDHGILHGSGGELVLVDDLQHHGLGLFNLIVVDTISRSLARSLVVDSVGLVELKGCIVVVPIGAGNNGEGTYSVGGGKIAVGIAVEPELVGAGVGTYPTI
ncbi:hypothetical protein, partial [Fibrobacter sp.]|uniref:hypothetical protein n=1 Tax=Fibrobacter sp. TaxID=35828 RepID=UPI0038692869